MKQSKRLLYILFFISFCLHNSLFSQGLLINEIMSSNGTTISDEDGDYGDWIELYNAADTSINLLGYYISDDINNLQRWNFPEIIIEPGNFLLIFASGKDRTEGEYLHTNFKISKNGEPILLSNPKGEIIDYIAPVKMQTDISYGRLSDEQTKFVRFIKPTPGYNNIWGIIYQDLIFSDRGGIYDEIFNLSLSCSEENANIYYTIDGSIPDTNSNVYESPLELNLSLYSDVNLYQNQLSPDSLHYEPEEEILKAIVIRAVAYNDLNQQISNVITNSYFIKELGIEHESLPIISITVNKDDLLDDSTGIMVPGIHFDSENPNWTGNYYQRGIEWEKYANVEFYEPDNIVGFNQQVGLRIHGGNTRRPPQKSFRVYARSKYGNSTINYSVYEDKPISEFKRLVFKSFYASWSGAGMEDYLANKIAREINIDNTAIRPAVLYLNGEYWGIYYIQERRDKYFTYYNYGINPDKVDIIYNYFGATQEGNSADFLSLYEFIENNDLSDQYNYNIVSNWMDIDNFIDYQLFEIFIANYDWPANNSMFWRERNTDNKWRWMFTDGDSGFQNKKFDGFSHALSTSDNYWPTNAQSTLFLRKLIENQKFKNDFFNRLEYLLNNNLFFDNTQTYAITAENFLNNEVNNQIDRFYFPENKDYWNDKIENIFDFLEYRACKIVVQVKEMFDVELNIPNCGSYYEIERMASLSLFPNPAQDFLFIEMENSIIYNAQIIIYDNMGREISGINKNITGNRIEMDVSNLNSGIYLITIITDNEIITERLVKI